MLVEIIVKIYDFFYMIKLVGEGIGMGMIMVYVIVYDY